MAMSTGLPVIVSDLDPMKEIIKNDINGLLHKSSNSIDLAQKIDFYLENKPEKFSKYSENALHTMMTEYSWDIIGKKYREFMTDS